MTGRGDLSFLPLLLGGVCDSFPSRISTFPSSSLSQVLVAGLLEKEEEEEEGSLVSHPERDVSITLT